jgi:hypothetical protein
VCVKVCHCQTSAGRQGSRQGAWIPRSSKEAACALRRSGIDKDKPSERVESKKLQRPCFVRRRSQAHDPLETAIFVM